MGPDQLIVQIPMQVSSRRSILGHRLFFKISFFLVLNIISVRSFSYCNIDGPSGIDKIALKITCVNYLCYNALGRNSTIFAVSYTIYL
jgi:hypothetical protein